MKIRLISRKQNPLLNRVEVTFEVKHEDSGGTPSRFEVRKRLATFLKTGLESVYIKKMKTKTGTMIAVGMANVYDPMEKSILIEPKHILSRNTPRKKEENSQ